MNTARKLIKTSIPRKTGPRRGSFSPGALLCLLALAVAVKPLADIVANYACCDRHKKADQDFQHLHLPSAPRVEKGSTATIP